MKRVPSVKVLVECCVRSSCIWGAVYGVVVGGDVVSSSAMYSCDSKEHRGDARPLAVFYDVSLRGCVMWCFILAKFTGEWDVAIFHPCWCSSGPRIGWSRSACCSSPSGPGVSA